MRSLAIFVACLMPACFAHAQIPQTERTALIALYKATDGANWTYSFNWRNGDDTDFNAVGTECTWDGVTCDGGHVTEIVLGGYPSGNNLVGTIPSELGNLSNLTELSLTYNQLSGSIPPELGTLSNLIYLYLQFNELSGTIPPELGTLENLDVLYLYSNQLSGAIPPELASLTNLHSSYTDIGYNALWTDDPTLQAFLDSKDPDWDETQTIAPAGLTVLSVSDRTAWLEWTPIVYTGNNGGYEVFSEPVVMRAATSGGFTRTKDATTFPVTDLVPGESYDFTVSTFTWAHVDNPQNKVVSELTAPEMATTSDTGCAAPEITMTVNFPYTLTASSHDTWEWSTGETTQSIEVRPHWGQWFWVRTSDVGGCDEAAVVFAVEDLLFTDDFESGDIWFWSDFSFW